MSFTSTAQRHVVKRYSLARLYDTSTAEYLDVTQLRVLARLGAEVLVLDAGTNEDITAALLHLKRC
jgi:polyhydroxyalkanoate synthesis regulator protein